MSLLNSEAIKVILIEPDILAEQGKLQSIWDMFTSNINYKNNDNLLLKTIVNGMNDNVIKHLSLNDDKCLGTINQYHKMVGDIRKSNISNNSLTNFMYVLDKSLNDYMTINDKNIYNIKFNMNDNLINPSYQEQSKILSTMLSRGLLSPVEVQDLIDDQNINMVTTANCCVNFCRTGDSPSPRDEQGCDVDTALQLSFEDFGTCVNELIDCIKSLIESDEDLFPKSPLDLKQMLFPIEKFDTQTLYRQKTYIPNIASYGILSTTLKYLEDSFELDNETVIYSLSFVMDSLKNIMNHFNKALCLLCYMVSGALMIRYLKKSSDNDSEIRKIKKNIADAYSIFMNLTETEPSKISDMVRIPEELKNFVSMNDDELLNGRLFNNETNSDLDSDIEVALNDILSDIEEIEATLEEGYGISWGKRIADSNVGCSSNDLSSLIQMSGVSSREETMARTFVKIISETSAQFHSDLNQSLLERNFECAANQIALEVALLEYIDNQSMCSPEVQKVTNSLKRDIMTYKDRVNSSSTGIDTYQDSARSYITSLF